MAERAPASLLDFAIAASIAVVPVLLGVVAPGRGRSARPMPMRRAAARSDRYVSVRLVAALKTFEPAVAARAPPSLPRVPDGAGVLAALPAMPARMARRRRAGAPGWPRTAWRARAPPPPAEQIAAQLAALRRRAARLQQPQQRAGRRIRSASMPARWFARGQRRAGDADREPPTSPGQPLPAALRRSRRRARGAARAATRAMLDSLAWRGSESRRAARALARRRRRCRSRRAR